MRLTTLSTVLTFTACVADISSVPLFMWSPRRFFTDSSCVDKEASNVFSASDVGGGVRRLSKIGPQSTREENALLKHFSDNAPSNRPEVIMAFIYPTLSSATASRAAGAYLSDSVQAPAFKYLGSALGSAASCISAPYVDVTGEKLSTTLEAAVTADSKSSIVSVTLADESSCAAAASMIKAKSTLFTNQATDLIIVRAGSHKDFDNGCMQTLIGLVGAATQDNFVALLSADDAPELVTDFSSPALQAHMDFTMQQTLGSSRALLATDSATNVPLYYVSTPIVMGLGVMFTFLIFLWIGIGCLMSVESPQRFASEGLPVVKEY